MIAPQSTWHAGRRLHRLIRARARRVRLPAADLDDVTQEILVRLSAFRFDPRKARGAGENTVLVAVIDRCLRMWLRTRRREQKRRERLQAMAPSALAPSEQRRIGLQLDVRRAVEGLGTEDRRLCQALSQGQSIAQIAQRFGWNWHTVKRRIQELQQRFRQWGLEDWLDE